MFPIGNFLIVSLLIVGIFSFPVEKDGQDTATTYKPLKNVGGYQNKDLLPDLPLPLSEKVTKLLEKGEEIIGTMDNESTIAGAIQHKDLLDLLLPLSYTVPPYLL
ncbi:unnamed protein product [Orchesella dallaii]|uniref:Uncharacterized protein n=1 Tax=Orchesella dallaii TaxID=48710 RepID=A0ABP1PR85_9HEXA